MLSDKEKQELLRLSQSQKFKLDMQRISKMPKNSQSNKLFTIDRYIQFLRCANNFMNHKRKPFRKIEGDNFKI
ncbi:MAG: hypothetical protein ACMUIP_00670 [bacterium]